MRIGNYAIESSLHFNNMSHYFNLGANVAVAYRDDHSPAIYINVDLIFIEWDLSVYNVNHKENE